MKLFKEIAKLLSAYNPESAIPKNDGHNWIALHQNFKWVICNRYECTPGLLRTKEAFLEELKLKDFYTEAVNWTGEMGTEVVYFHGPYRLSEVSSDSYVVVRDRQALEILKNTLDDEAFHNGEAFDEKFKTQVLDQIGSLFFNQEEIYWLSKKYEQDMQNWRYDFWAEFIVRMEKEFYYITIGED